MNKRQQLSLPPLSLYIHIPWCVRKCPYCDFNSHESASIPESIYVTALIDDLDKELNSVQGRELQSIFFGGGTPSLFSEQAIENILNTVENKIGFASDIEITLEANPGTAEQSRFRGYRAAGVNRLSIGIQSFQQYQLQKLGRIHTKQEAIDAVNLARKSGFSNINIDLMHGLPEQTESQGLADLHQAFELGPSHISWYQLTIEPNTAFYSSPPILPSEDHLADIQQAGEALLAANGFFQYETSAYSTTNRHSRHNTNYWLFGDYIGIGAGAHGKITDLSTGTLTRNWKTRQPNHYLNPDKEYISGARVLTKSEIPVEFLMNALRLNNGFEVECYGHRTGLDFSALRKQIDGLIGRDLLLKHNNRIKPTVMGRRFLNNILAEF